MHGLHSQVKGCINTLASVYDQAHKVQTMVGFLVIVEVQEGPTPAPHGVQEAIPLICQSQPKQKRLVQISGGAQDVDMQDVRFVGVMKESAITHKE
jgi:hypothetical protein